MHTLGDSRTGFKFTVYVELTECGMYNVILKIEGESF